MKLGKEIKQPKEMEAIYDDDSGRCGKFIYDTNRRKWEYVHQYKMDEDDCFEAYKILKKLNNAKIKRGKTSSTRITR